LHSYRKFESALLDPTFEQVDCDFSAAIACEEKKKNGKRIEKTKGNIFRKTIYYKFILHDYTKSYIHNKS
jgi:hypothetical protein